VRHQNLMLITEYDLGDISWGAG